MVSQTMSYFLELGPLRFWWDNDVTLAPLHFSHIPWTQTVR
jgi:hypothetical protein